MYVDYQFYKEVYNSFTGSDDEWKNYVEKYNNCNSVENKQPKQYRIPIDEKDWTELERISESHIDKLTFNRLHHGFIITDNVKKAVCAIAEVIAKYKPILENAVHSCNVKSENNDGYSVNYVSITELKSEESQAIYDSVSIYLLDSDLMCRSILI